MRLIDVDPPTLQQLNSACGGVFSVVLNHCEEVGLEAHLSVQTHLEGLEYGEMKLFIQLMGEQDMKDYAVARLEGSAKVIGWNLYLHDITSSAKAKLRSATVKIDKAAPPERLLH